MVRIMRVAIDECVKDLQACTKITSVLFQISTEMTSSALNG